MVQEAEEQEDLVAWLIRGQVAGVVQEPEEREELEEREDLVAWLIRGQVLAQLADAGQHPPATGGSGLIPWTG